MNRGALSVWSCVAAVAVLFAFHVLHSFVDHPVAIIMAGVVGIATGSLGYRWMSGDESRGALAVVGALGGVAGLLVLHLLPLIR